jgi:hypothetical protein
MLVIAAAQRITGWELALFALLVIAAVAALRRDLRAARRRRETHARTIGRPEARFGIYGELELARARPRKSNRGVRAFLATIPAQPGFRLRLLSCACFGVSAYMRDGPWSLFLAAGALVIFGPIGYVIWRARGGAPRGNA